MFAGRGFPLHRDSVPPFDLTLDFVLDHVGPAVGTVFLLCRFAVVVVFILLRLADLNANAATAHHLPPTT